MVETLFTEKTPATPVAEPADRFLTRGEPWPTQAELGVREARERAAARRADFKEKKPFSFSFG